jgi:hypothetical protein
VGINFVERLMGAMAVNQSCPIGRFLASAWCAFLESRGGLVFPFSDAKDHSGGVVQRISSTASATMSNKGA